MVSEADHGVLEMPYDPASTVAGVAPDRAFARVGADVVAGVACIEWQTADRAGRAVTVCMTRDGVLLRARAGAEVLVQALRVDYGAIDPSVFQIPAGYRRVLSREAGR